jgi:hypothetical protein
MLRIGRFRKYGVSPLIYISRRLTVLELKACLFVSSHKFAACSKLNFAAAEIFRQPIFVPQFVQSAVGKFSIFGFQRAAKLLASAF